MRTRQDIESYLATSGYVHKELAEGTWVVHEPMNPQAKIVVRLEGDLVLFRLRVMDLASVKRREPLYEKLLALNASEMVHGAYGLAEDAVVMTCVLRLQTLDLEEFRGTVDDFALSLSKHRESLGSYCA
jgi:hypothetical protein